MLRPKVKKMKLKIITHERIVFEGEVDETELNDFLWFEDEFIFEELGISNDEDDDEDEEDW